MRAETDDSEGEKLFLYKFPSQNEQQAPHLY